MVGQKIKLSERVHNDTELDDKWKGKTGFVQEVDQEDCKIILDSGEKFWINRQFCETFTIDK